MTRFVGGLVLAGLVWGQREFRPNAELGAPARVGSVAAVIGRPQEVLEIGTLREVTLESVELALTFPNRVGSVVAKADEKLLIVRGRLRNPERKSVIGLGPGSVIGLRLWEKYTGTGKFQFVNHYDPETLHYLRKDLKGGESGAFVGVWRFPADFRDFRLGVTSDRPEIVAWYDLSGAVGRLKSIYAAEDGIGVKPGAKVGAGQAFEIDGIEITPRGVTMPRAIGGAAVEAAKPAYVMNVRAVNRMLAPVRWGWQYFTVELICADGSVTKAYPEIYDAGTGRAWAGDLGPGAAVESQFLFYPGVGKRPRAMRFTVLESGRWAELALAP